MTTRRFIAGLTLAIALAIAAGCGGSSNTTIINQTVTAPATDEVVPGGSTTPTGATNAPVMMDFGSQEFTEPAEFSFSVNGDLTAGDLQWSGWGEPTAQADGQLAFRDYPSTKRVEIPGTVTVSRLKECKGKNYYTRVSFDYGSGAPFDPNVPDLPTPCD